MIHPKSPIVNTNVKKKPLKLSIGLNETRTLSGLEIRSIANTDSELPIITLITPESILF